MRISELSSQLGVPVSTVRYYERIGLLGPPARSSSGYRNYDDESATRLLFVTRARGLGFSCDQVAELLPIWGGADCTPTREHVAQLIDAKLAEISLRIAELTRFSEQLSSARDELVTGADPASCSDDLDCCLPATRAKSLGAEPEEHHVMLRLIDQWDQ